MSAIPIVKWSCLAKLQTDKYIPDWTGWIVSFEWGSCCSSFNFLCCVLWTIVVFLTFFFALLCLSFDIRLLVVHFVQTCLKMKHYAKFTSLANVWLIILRKKNGNSKSAIYLRVQNSKIPQMLHETLIKIDKYIWLSLLLMTLVRSLISLLPLMISITSRLV